MAQCSVKTKFMLVVKVGSFTCDQSNCYPGYTNWRPNVGQYNSDLPVGGTKLVQVVTRF